jgi:FtsH-binding integral membrane protein
MSFDTQQLSYVSAAEAPAEQRVAFIRRTYQHLALAVLAFVALEWIFFQTGVAEKLAATMLGGRWSWLIVLGGFMAVSWIAQRWADSHASREMQYLGLGVYVVAEAIIFVPILYLASRIGPTVIPTAGLITTLLFGGLTVVAFTTRKDFSFLGGILKIGGFIALGVIVASIAFGFNLGLLFSAVMVAFAAAAILYSTSNVLHRYNPEQHVAASLSLFASVALLFWYILRIVMSFSNRD